MRSVLLVFLATCTFSVLAQSAVMVEKAPPNFEKALQSSNNGLVESTIFHTVKFKLFYPDQNVEGPVKQLDRLVQEGTSEVIRYKAYLAWTYLTNPALLAGIEKKDYKDGDLFFLLLSTKLQKQLLAGNTIP